MKLSDSRYIKVILTVIAALLFLNYITSISESQTEQKFYVGRFQISSFGNISVGATGLDGVRGYYVLDTALGKVVAEDFKRVGFQNISAEGTRIDITRPTR